MRKRAVGIADGAGGCLNYTPSILLSLSRGKLAFWRDVCCWWYGQEGYCSSRFIFFHERGLMVSRRSIWKVVKTGEVAEIIFAIDSEAESVLQWFVGEKGAKED